MLLRILKKDMRRKKGINVILFLFIIISTVFLASSVNNMFAVGNATEYFLDKGQVPDVFISGYYEEGNKEVAEWIEAQEDMIDDYSYRESLIIGDKNVAYQVDGEKKAEYKSDVRIYIEANSSDYVKVFDQEGNSVHIKKGEIGLLATEAERLGLTAGDKLFFDIGETTKEYTISTLLKDPVYVGSMSGMIRFIVNEADYEELRDGSSIAKADFYYIMTEDMDKVERELVKHEFSNSPNLATKETIKSIYVMNLIVAGMLTAIGICLIMIAVLVLRFTIVFTIQEEYREIGIMKAIGVRDFGIKKLYLIKYFAIVLVGAIIGCIISFPIGDAMLQSVSTTMLMEDSASNGICNLICSIFVVIIVMLLCYGSMGKLNKLSVMDAIRSGDNGERYHKKSVFRLGKSKRIPIPLFLAVNDIFSNMKQYIVLLLVLSIGIVLMIVPINAINTMKSSAMSESFKLDNDANLFVDGLENEKNMPIKSMTELYVAMDKVEQTLQDDGYNVDLDAVIFKSIAYQTSDISMSIISTQTVNSSGEYLKYLEGSAPIKENEVAFSKKMLKVLGLSIGDTIQAKIDGGERDLIITGTYQDYMQLGKSATLNPVIGKTDDVPITYWCIPLYIDTEKSSEALQEELQEKYPEYEFLLAQEIVNRNVGGIVDAIDAMRIWLVLLISAINAGITILMMKMFMLKEKGQIAMLRSVGFQNRAIRHWQVLRMVVLLIIADLLSIPLSRLMDVTVLKSIFGIMGAEITCSVKPLEAYVLYPLVILAGIVLAAIYTSADVRKIDIREISNLE